MGKRSDFERHERDYYPTPLKAALPLYRYVRGMTYCEPCAGGNHLVRALKPVARCVAKYDIEPQHSSIVRLDFRQLEERHLNGAELIITNPPWKENLLREMIEHFTLLRPTWLLLSSALVNNERFCTNSMKYMSDFVPVGRISWLQNGKSGFEDAAWYRFDRGCTHEYYKGWPRVFSGR
jgi:hypothetical protein